MKSYYTPNFILINKKKCARKSSQYIFASCRFFLAPVKVKVAKEVTLQQKLMIPMSVVGMKNFARKVFAYVQSCCHGKTDG